MAQWLACWAHNPKVRGSKPRSAISLEVDGLVNIKRLIAFSWCGDESGWCPDVASTHGAWRHAGVRFLLRRGFDCLWTIVQYCSAAVKIIWWLVVVFSPQLSRELSLMLQTECLSPFFFGEIALYWIVAVLGKQRRECVCIDLKGVRNMQRIVLWENSSCAIV